MGKKLTLTNNVVIDKANLDLEEVLNIYGSTGSANCVNDLDKFYTGITLVTNSSKAPTTDWWMIISGGVNTTQVQLAFSLFNNHTAKMRNCAAGTWSSWANIKIS